MNFCHNIVKVAVDPQDNSWVGPLTTLTTLWRNSLSLHSSLVTKQASTCLPFSSRVVVSLVTWSLNGTEARGDLALIHLPRCFYCVNQAWLASRQELIVHFQVQPKYFNWLLFLQLSAWWPGLWMAARLEVTLFWCRPHCFYCASQVVLTCMLTSLHLHGKSRQVCIKGR